MKKLLLSAACLLGFVAMNAQTTATFIAPGYTTELTGCVLHNGDGSDTGTSGNLDASLIGQSFTDEGVTITFLNGSSGSNYSACYGNHVRLYQGGEITVAIPEGSKLTGINCMIASGSKGVFQVKDDGGNVVGTVTGTGTKAGETVTWAGEVSGTATVYGVKQVRFNYIQFVIEGSSAPARPAAPTFDPASGLVEAGTEVTISCATEGAEIRYTLDGTEPTANSTLYTAAIVVNEDLTIKAISVKDGVESNVATATYTVPVVYTKLAELVVLGNNATFTFKGEFVVVFASGSYTYIYDGETYALIYMRDLGLEAGDKVTSAWSGKVSIYNNLIEFVPEGALEADGTGVIPEPVAVTVANFDEYWSTSMQNTYVRLKDVVATTTDGAMTFTMGDEAVILYNRGFCDMPTEDDTYDVVGFMSVFKEDIQLYPIQFSTTQGVENVAASNNARVEYFNLQGIRVSNPTNGIYVRRQGNEVSKVVIR